MISKPVKNKNAVITCGYTQGVHEAVDFAVNRNPNCVPIYCTKRGQVTVANYNPNSSGGFGKVLYIRLEDGWYSVYAHFAFICDDFRVGDWVEAGDFLGIMGKTGLGTGQHLHYQEKTKLTKGGESRYPSDVMELFK
jgi:murein DD-endopeptidase MepM/ murein hydrolase activator NlpD